MREAGNSIHEIASTLDMSRELVQGIARMFETEEVLSARSRRFLENIRQADDPDKKWRASYLMQALRLKTITQNALIHFRWAGTPQISLRELMDLAISEKGHPKPGFLITPLLGCRCVGEEGFWFVVSRLTEADLGGRCNQEWDKRLARLRQCSRIVGGLGSRSKPCKPPSWLSRPKTGPTSPQLEPGLR
jgi:hypothetical protein